jgi:hypothetical protein
MISAGCENGVSKLLHPDVTSVRRKALLLLTYIVNQPISSKPNPGM